MSDIADAEEHPDATQPVHLRADLERRLREAIVSGRYLPGEHLSDRRLCETFDVSRSVTREALRRLEAEGLVVIFPNRGTFVARLSAADAAQVYEVRAMLEALAGRGFAERASDRERQELRAAYEALAAAKREIGPARLIALKKRFYSIMIEGCRNEYVVRMLGQLLNRNAQLRALALSDPDRFPLAVRELRRVVEAIERRDPEGAWKACHEHVTNASIVVLRMIRESEAKEAEESAAG